MTQVAFSKLLGVSDWTVKRIEGGHRLPSQKLALRISKLTGIDPAALRPDLGELLSDIAALRNTNTED